MRLGKSVFPSFTEDKRKRKSSTVLLTQRMSVIRFIYDVVKLVVSGVLTGIFLGLIAKAAGWR